MLSKAAVLNGNHSFGDVGGEFVNADLIAKKGAPFGDDLAVRGKQDHARLTFGNPEQPLLIERKPHIGGETGKADQSPQTQHDAPGHEAKDDRLTPAVSAAAELFTATRKELRLGPRVASVPPAPGSEPKHAHMAPER